MDNKALQLTEQFMKELPAFVRRNSLFATDQEILEDFMKTVYPILKDIRNK